jgi:D-arabinose 1-dehydrogenase-like Zn-dependent alcohol dehydrogenase
MTTQPFRLENANAALAAWRDGKVKGAAVITPAFKDSS